MSDLQDNIALDRKRMAWLGGITAAAVLGFYCFVYRPSQKHLERLRVGTTESRTELADSQQKVIDLPRIERQVDALKVKLENSKRLLDPADLAKAHGEITVLGQRLQLENFKYDVSVERPMDRCRELPIVMSFDAGFPQAFQFLKDCEQLQRLMRTRRLVMRSRDDNDGRVSCEMTMNIYLSER